MADTKITDHFEPLVATAVAQTGLSVPPYAC